MEQKIHKEIDGLWSSLSGAEVSLVRERLAEHVEKVVVAPNGEATLYPKVDGLFAHGQLALVWRTFIAGMGVEPTLKGF